MFQILLLWLMQFLVFFGYGEIFGRLVLRRWWPSDTWLRDTFARFWIGVTVVFTFLELWYLFRPINGTCWRIVVAIGILGCGFSVFGRKGADGIGRETKLREDFWHGGLALTVSLLLALLVACRIAACPTEDMPADSGLYHLTLLRWMNEYPAVPGLANLHYRFGMNSGFLRYAALWNTGFLRGHAAWIVSYFFEIITLTQWLVIIFLPREGLVSRSFCLLSLPFLLQAACNSSVSLYYDSFPLTVILVLVVNALRAWGKDESPGMLHAPRFFLLLCLGSLAFVGKPIGALTLFLVFVVGAVVLVRAWRRHENHSLKLVLQCLSLPALLVVAYMALSIVLSGWPLFPLPVGRVPVDWAMPEKDVQELYTVIKYWARLPGPPWLEAQEGFWRWFPTWVTEQFNPALERRVFLGCLFAVPAYFLCRLGTPWDRRRWLELALLGLAAANLAFWFCSAPTLRFGNAFFWCFYALLVGFWLERILRKTRLVLGVAALLAFYWCTDFVGWLPWRPCSAWELAKAPPGSTRMVTLPTGQTPPLVVRMPKGIPGKLWSIADSPLPAIPQLPSESLRWRVPGKLRNGFKIVPGSPEITPAQDRKPEDAPATP